MRNESARGDLPIPGVFSWLYCPRTASIRANCGILRYLAIVLTNGQKGRYSGWFCNLTRGLRVGGLYLRTSTFPAPHTAPGAGGGYLAASPRTWISPICGAESYSPTGRAAGGPPAPPPRASRGEVRTVAHTRGLFSTRPRGVASSGPVLAGFTLAPMKTDGVAE